jgi:hypothetical protein
MKRAVVRVLALAAAVSIAAVCWHIPQLRAQVRLRRERPGAAALAAAHVGTRLADDYGAMKTFRPGYSFWQHIFTIPDGSIAFGSAIDGRLLAVFPARGDWARQADWKEPALAHLLDGQRLPKDPNKRREQLALLLEDVAGPVVHNPTRGLFVQPNARRYGDFLQEWSAIYARFGVPGEIGLAQALIESGLNGTRRSAARAVGFCQWLARNWKELNRLSPYVIEGNNQTTQAPYCAAYLAVLATKYGSFIPALSEHHTGGTNVGRTLINGERLGGEDIRRQYFVGSQFAHDLRRISLLGYRDIYRTYGPRSYLYAEMVFGNTFNIGNMMASRPQTRIYAMRPSSAIPVTEIARRTHLTLDDGTAVQSSAAPVRAGGRHSVPSLLREGVRPRRLVLAHSPKRGIRVRTERFPAYRRDAGTVGRSLVRTRVEGIPEAVRADQQRGRHRFRDRAGLRHRRGVFEPSGPDPGGVPKQRAYSAAVRSRRPRLECHAPRSGRGSGRALSTELEN